MEYCQILSITKISDFSLVLKKIKNYKEEENISTSSPNMANSFGNSRKNYNKSSLGFKNNSENVIDKKIEDTYYYSCFCLSICRK